MNSIGLDKLILEALSEDLGTGDITTESCVSESAVSEGVFRAKQDGVFCGMAVLERVFKLVDGRVTVTPLVSDGDEVVKGQGIAKVAGPSRSVLAGERVSLNLVQHMSGVATATRKAVRAVEGTSSPGAASSTSKTRSTHGTPAPLTRSAAVRSAGPTPGPISGISSPPARSWACVWPWPTTSISTTS